MSGHVHGKTKREEERQRKQKEAGVAQHKTSDKRPPNSVHAAMAHKIHRGGGGVTRVRYDALFQCKRNRAIEAAEASRCGSGAQQRQQPREVPAHRMPRSGMWREAVVRNASNT